MAEVKDRWQEKQDELWAEYTRRVAAEARAEQAEAQAAELVEHHKQHHAGDLQQTLDKLDQAEVIVFGLQAERDRLKGELDATTARCDEWYRAAERLRAALEMVEWVGGHGLGEADDYCPWCHVVIGPEHKPDCPRQAALAGGGG